MQNVACPGCGAEIAFRSHASVMAVCAYCKTTVLKDAESVKDIGKMSDVLTDYSPIQIGTSGMYRERAFTVAGRIQLRYDAGMWNEWYLVTDDGGADEWWLSDASGMYTITAGQPPGEEALPEFSDLQPAHSHSIDGKPYTVGDVRTAECLGGQGELPVNLRQGYRVRVADLRNGADFLTLDYSDGARPRVYLGQATTLDALQCQLLRDDDVIGAAAGKFGGKVKPLACPACGGNIDYVPGITPHLVCPACHAQIDTSGTVAQAQQADARLEAMPTTLALGAKATISGKGYTLIGVMIRRDDESQWTEYLLHNGRAGFIWLVETDDGWSRAQVQESWPAWEAQGDAALLDGKRYAKKYDYRAEVIFAAGAFNWKVKVGDALQVVEFESGQQNLVAEISDQELTWSLGTPVGSDQIDAWFEVATATKSNKKKNGSLSGVVAVSIGFVVFLNFIPLLEEFRATWWYTAIAIAAIYFPAKFLDKGA